ncbi:hypothetical protein E2C01_007056 [Portunus trituberculatus]|uniref:Uncharacterized protein n=1 Tax=Portunus trituberculatus TaxID=210409 RepID=A0A5B7D3H1_PORTR|nr:hypothetical protein [Portunus trituberculatus]
MQVVEQPVVLGCRCGGEVLLAAPLPASPLGNNRPSRQRCVKIGGFEVESMSRGEQARTTPDLDKKKGKQFLQGMCGLLRQAKWRREWRMVASGEKQQADVVHHFK